MCTRPCFLVLHVLIDLTTSNETQCFVPGPTCRRDPPLNQVKLNISLKGLVQMSGKVSYDQISFTFPHMFCHNYEINILAFNQGYPKFTAIFDYIDQRCKLRAEAMF